MTGETGRGLSDSLLGGAVRLSLHLPSNCPKPMVSCHPRSLDEEVQEEVELVSPRAE